MHTVEVGAIYSNSNRDGWETIYITRPTRLEAALEGRSVARSLLSDSDVIRASCAVSMDEGARQSGRLIWTATRRGEVDPFDYPAGAPGQKWLDLYVEREYHELFV